MKIEIYRSEAFCQSTAAATGLPVSKSIVIEVDPRNLTIPCRELLQAIVPIKGSWPDLPSIGYYPDFSRSWGSRNWGSEQFFCDKLEPTDDDISAAILSAEARIAAKQAEKLAKDEADMLVTFLNAFAEVRE
jgi:hypothetical protein